jgi:hypothetical protein
MIVPFLPRTRHRKATIFLRPPTHLLRPLPDNLKSHSPSVCPADIARHSSRVRTEEAILRDTRVSNIVVQSPKHTFAGLFIVFECLGALTPGSSMNAGPTSSWVSLSCTSEDSSSQTCSWLTRLKMSPARSPLNQSMKRLLCLDFLPRMRTIRLPKLTPQSTRYSQTSACCQLPHGERSLSSIRSLMTLHTPNTATNYSHDGRSLLNL